MNIVVDISDMKFSSDKNDVLITYALGSCIGVSIYDPETGIGGLMHSMLPLSKIDTFKAKTRPYIYTDTALTSLLKALFEQGVKRSNLVVKIAGCSNGFDEKKLFNIGERNYTIARKILWKNDILISGEDVGGNKPRTLRLDIKTGKTYMKTNGFETEL